MSGHGGVAVFVDGDNLSSAHAPAILGVAHGLGTVSLARVYGNVELLPGWDGLPGIRLLHAGRGKNAADLLLTIDAMEHACTGSAERFVLASSDRDFTHLAHRLRERGFRVMGLGEEKAPESFRAACTDFRVLAPPERACATTTVAATAESTTQPDRTTAELDKAKGCDRPTELDRLVRRIIAANSLNGEGMAIARLGSAVVAACGMTAGDLPGGRWRPYLAGRPALYDLDPKGPTAKVRFLPRGFNGAG